MKIARAALLAVFPAELTLVVLLLSGADVPAGLILAAEAAVPAVLALELTVACRVFAAARRDGADRRAALREVRDRLVPRQVLRLAGFELKGNHSLLLWAARRRSGVPEGAVEVSYAREQTFTQSLWLFAMTVELVGFEILLRGLGVPDWLRILVLVVDVYGLLMALGMWAACVTRPHVVTRDELRLRSGAYFDARIPRDRIAAVRSVRNLNETGLIRVEDGTAAVVVASRTNLVVELTEPVTIVRPMGARAEVRAIRFFADDPAAALTALRTSPAPAPSPELALEP
ncbi:hypothetical protein [Actinomadura rugatobispora]|uniref:Uncharacterized protein n=1 Tax=Actinomadura rugatobispora TaxID=1994 RepID=A0ABW1A5D6_9ACTN